MKAEATVQATFLVSVNGPIVDVVRFTEALGDLRRSCLGGVQVCTAWSGDDRMRGTTLITFYDASAKDTVLDLLHRFGFDVE